MTLTIPPVNMNLEKGDPVRIEFPGSPTEYGYLMSNKFDIGYGVMVFAVRTPSAPEEYPVNADIIFYDSEGPHDDRSQ